MRSTASEGLAGATDDQPDSTSKTLVVEILGQELTALRNLQRRSTRNAT